MKNISLLILLCIASFGFAQSRNEIKTEADSCYQRGDYLQAIHLYQSCLQQGESPDVYYNLGNSYYKSDSLGLAILNYERALLFDPGDNDVRNNLAIARSKIVDKVTEVPDVFFVAWLKAWIHTAGADTWAKWSILCFLVLIGAVSFFIFTKNNMLKKLGLATSLVCVALVILTNIFAASQKKALIVRDKAIILKPSVTVRSTPDTAGNELFIIHEGRKVRIKDDTMNSWKEISLENDKVGWVSADDLAVI